MKKRSILAQRPNVLNELKAICSVPYLPTDDLSRSIPDAKADLRTVTNSEGTNRPVVQPPRGGTVPGGDDPATPGGGDPSTPGGGDPTTPGGGDPTIPGGGDPTNPGGGDPMTPGGGDPPPPGGSDPTMPGGNDPTTPGGGDPITPGGADPTTPGGGTTSPPPGGEPTTPGEGEPSTPGAGDPSSEPEGPRDYDRGTEIYHTTKRGIKCLDVRYDWRYNGSPVQLYECNGTPAQKWIIKRGETKVRLAGTDYCLDAGEHPANFVSMKLWKCYDGLPAQQWWFTHDNGIAVKDQGQCLDLKDGIFENWAKVQTYKCTDYNTNQIWTV